MHIDVYGDTLCAHVAAAALASSGHAVTLFVSDAQQLAALQAGHLPWREPGLMELMADQIASGRLRLGDAQQLPAAVGQVLWLAKAPNRVEQAHALLQRLAAQVQGDWLVVNQSTFPVGSTETLQATLDQYQFAAGAHHEVISLPDLLTEGAALQGFLRAEQWLLGADSEWARRQVMELLRPFNRRRDVVQVMRPREAEFTKLAISGMLATRLSYMNDMANLADTLGVDIERVRLGMGADSRIGEAYLYPGCGFGGLKFSRDVMSLASTLEVSGMQAQLLDQVLRINERQKEVLFRKLWRHYGTHLKGRRVAIWGVAFKPETGRIDNAPSLRMLEALWAQGVQVHVHDPQALPELHSWAGERADLILHDDPYSAAEQADALVLLTEWKAYWSPDFPRLAHSMKAPLLLDGRNIWDPDFVREHGFDYYGIGRR
ncbi:UDP-glucose dehydrogenase family protein [Halopseudomonas phragmitis]|uniref:UDP-glucose 6-dehydrogenase n=1 Tax=Halopseudomonas phragmitis TaxID=1931241 RepID=A0A1V0B5V6_9GAMM|nr:nucleotide sugar dehydrogenase [Halopseudomonas phragmitis]AQZ95295.1 NDP-sugar dehydrogenase [Halopseudomonas phragmitis]